VLVLVLRYCGKLADDEIKELISELKLKPEDEMVAIVKKIQMR